MKDGTTTRLVKPPTREPEMTSDNTLFEVSRRAMLSAFAALPVLPILLPGSAQAQSGAGTLPASPAAQVPITDPLPAWNDTASKTAIFNFVERVTKQGSPDFVPEGDRIATFDNDGTLWAEQPMYFQLLFALDRVKALAPKHPEWKTEEPFASLLKGDLKGALAGGEPAIFKLVVATHSGTTVEEFNAIARDWFTTAKHPITKRLYTEMIYQPMLELLAYLRANAFKTFIVSGGGIDFIRMFSERVYGIPTQQVVGSSGKTKFEMQDGKSVLTRLPEINFINDGPGKPVGINAHIGRRPIAAFGNSDGDMQMLQYTTGGGGARFGLIVHHTDAIREWAYDRQSSIGKLDKALDAAPAAGWTVVDMKNDWKTIFPFGSK
jgi:phosphoglycolate phosphatase-like HAD superfamily hydrolase